MQIKEILFICYTVYMFILFIFEMQINGLPKVLKKNIKEGG